MERSSMESGDQVYDQDSLNKVLVFPMMEGKTLFKPIVGWPVQPEPWELKVKMCGR